MRCVIVDDEGMARIHLARLCQRIKGLEIVDTFADAMSAYQFLENNPIDLVFLDIEMPDFSGIELVQQLRQPPAIIFTTSKENYAVEAFELIESVVDYLVKPLTLARLLLAVERYRKRAAAIPVSTITLPDTRPAVREPSLSEKHIFVKTERKYVRIDLEDLLYVETVGDYSIFKTAQQQYTVHATLKSIKERLCLPNFIKVHRSFIVNLDKIKDIEDSNLLIADRVIPVSRNHRAELMERIMPL
ncbi:MAG: LytTR family DNA-binding domain-containing protein [Bacteroidota bacterium]